MKLLFICGSLEPGKDGVGDYARRLGGELIRQGHQAELVAINDNHIDIPLQTGQITEGYTISTLRLPASKPWYYRIEILERVVQDFDPDWLSLQFVPFSFDNKGLPFFLAKHLKQIGDSRNWHIMLHELWVGMETSASLKHKLWGRIQAFIIKNLIKKLHPKQIHTQTKLYQISSHQLGFKADYLPLFSNIPVIDTCANISKEGSDELIWFIIFGSIHPNVPFKTFVEDVAKYAKEEHKNVKLTIIGRSGVEGKKALINNWKANHLYFEDLEEQNAEQVSKVLSMATIGLSTTPILLAEKSGSIAAMHAHKLHVISLANTWSIKVKAIIDLPAGVIEYKPGNLKDCISSDTLNEKSLSIQAITAQFIQDLKKQESNFN